MPDNKEYKRKWYSLNKVRILSQYKEWRAKNPIKVKAKAIRYLTKKKFNTETLQELYDENIKIYGVLTCYLCTKTIALGDDSIDHRIPTTRGGTNDKSNLGIAHKGCNSKKHTKTVEEYHVYKGS